MDEEKRRRLEAANWKIGTTAGFLGLPPEEATLVEIKAALARGLRERRRGRMTQVELAKTVGSSQLGIALAEQADGSVSLELLIRAMLAAGATPHDIGGLIASVRE